MIGSPVPTVWHLLNDVESYPHLMSYVATIKVLEHSPSSRLTRWEADISGCVMRWVQRDEIDQARHRIDYRAVEGDLAELTGYWQLEPLTDHTSRATMSVRFDIGIPMLSAWLDPIAKRAIHDRSQRMLAALASEASAARERGVQA